MSAGETMKVGVDVCTTMQRTAGKPVGIDLLFWALSIGGYCLDAPGRIPAGSSVSFAIVDPDRDPIHFPSPTYVDR